MNTNSFIANIKVKDIYADTEKHSAAKFDSSNYEVERPLLKRKIQKLLH